MATKRKSARKSPATRTRTVYMKPKRRATRRRRGLSQGFTQTAVKNSLEQMFVGAVVGVGAALVVENIEFVKQMNATNRALIIGAVGVAGSVMLKNPAIAAGAGAIAVRPLLQGLNILADNSPMIIPPISESDMAMLPSGLAGPDYAGLSQGPNVYASNYANRFNF